MFTFEYTDKIYKFLASSERNAWIYYPKLHMKVYVRKSKRYLNLNKSLSDCFDIASVEVEDEDNCGKGNFTRFLNQIEPWLKSLNKFDAIFVESIVNERLIPYLEKRGYQKVAENYNISINYYLLLR